MYSLYLSDIIKRAGLDLRRTKLIRHSWKETGFVHCFKNGFLKEYTQNQKIGFSDGYDYWLVFVSGQGTSAKFLCCYRASKWVLNTKENMPEGYPNPEQFDGQCAYYLLEYTSVLKDLENRLIIDWGKGTRSWHQKATNEKPVLAIQNDPQKTFLSYEETILTYKELKEILSDSNLYAQWHTALASVYAIYLITDCSTGKQYVGSAYGEGGLLARWKCYIETQHGGNAEIQNILYQSPNQYEHFQFSILQILPKTLTDEDVIQIETLYKRKLLTKEFGMNRN